MPISNLFDRFVHTSSPKSRGHSKRPQRKANRRRRALLESLEDRKVLASFSVITPGDLGTGSCSAVACTLRDAVLSANQTAEADDITIEASASAAITLNPASGSLLITAPVSITGLGADNLTVDGNATVANPISVFEVETTAGDVSFEGLTISGGFVPEAPGGGINFKSDGVLSIRSSVISGNSANNGGGVYSEYDGTIEITASTISGNTALYGPGGGIQNVDGDTTLSSSFVTNNRSYNSGGGLFSPYLGTVTITETEFSGNRVTEAGYHGGALYSGGGDLTISGSTITGNTSPGDAGGLYNYSGVLSISNSSITANEAGYSGAGVFNYGGSTSISDSSVSNNVSLYGDGGGISNANGSLTLTRSTISGNQAVTDGGGVSNSSGRIIVVESTLDNNTSGRDGGGIATLTGPVTLTNSTVSTNSANVRGGGVKSDSAAVRLVHSTFTLNNANIDGGGIGVSPNGNGESILIHNSIVAGNTSPIGPDFIAPNDPGTNLDVQSSMIGNNADTTLAPGSGVNGNFIGTPFAPENPSLGALEDNGGPTRTHVSFGFGNAVDTGNPALSLDFGADGAPGGGDDSMLAGEQRGGLFTRFSNAPDLGATEFQLAPTLQVDTASDVDNGDLSVGDRSLRELLQIANDNSGLDTILFDFQLSTINLDPALGPLVISDSVTFLGPSPIDLLTIQNSSGTPIRLFDITASAGEVSFSNLAFVGGDAGTENGGAIRSQFDGPLTITQSAFIGNSAASGGAISIEAGTLSIAASTFDQNTATNNGGGISASAATTAVDLVNVTTSGNSAVASGGGLYSENADVTIDNSTFTLNTADTSGGGIGLLADGNGEGLELNNTIVAGNTAPTGADFLAPMTPATSLDVNFSLVGDNAGTSLTESPLANDQPQPDSDGNLIGGGANPVIDPMLDPLADNGGPTPTHAPQGESLALDSGSSTILPQDSFDLDSDNNRFEFLPVDQRGAVRAVNTIDIGAVELAPAPTITWSNPDPIAVGTALDDTQLNAAASVAGSFTYTPPAGTILDAGDGQVLTAVFNPANPLSFRSVTTTVTIDVTRSNPVVTWATPDPITFGTLLSDTQLSAESDVAGSFVYDPAAGTQLDAGNQTLSVTFTPDDTANFNEVTQTVTLVVNPATPVVTWDNPPAITFGTALDDTQLNASSADSTGTFVYTPATGEILDAGTQTLSVTFTPDDTNFAETTATVSIVVNKADPVIVWNNPADIGGGTALSATQLNATATFGGNDLPGTFVYDPPAGTVLPGGDNQPLMVTFTPTDSDNLNNATATVFINVAVGEDFGDAPAGYPVTLADDGARHTTSSLILGTAVDAETDGQPSSDANGDGQDEDGVTVIASGVVSASDTEASFLIDVSEAGRLDAWIDFNGDDDWDDAGEQIATNLQVTAGSNQLNFTVPSTATAGTTAARFRVSSTGGLSPTGAAADGEVEDYLVTLLDGSTTPSPSIVLPVDATISIDATDLSVSSTSTNLFRAPTADLGNVSVQGGTADDTLSLDFNDGPGGGLNLDGLEGTNSLAILGSSVDFTSAGLVAAQNFKNIDLTDASANTIAIDAATVAGLSPADSTIVVTGGAGDAVLFGTPEDWRLTDPVINGNEFTQTVTNQVTGEVVLVNLPGVWQNPIENSDVNNNGEVTAGDALLIINELSRRSFSDSDTQNLDDPTSVTFPGNYYDQNGDNRATALDALRVINRISQLAISGGTGAEAEAALTELRLELEQAVVNDETISTVAASTNKIVGAASSNSNGAQAGVEIDAASDDSDDAWSSAVDQLLSDEGMSL